MKRVEWIDNLRGLGIVFVIIGHMSIPDMLRQFVFSFHMPLFFMISGYLYKNDFSFKWCMRKLDSLFIPYLVYGILTLAVLTIEGRYQMAMVLHNYLLGNGVGVLWFLPCLLVTEFLGGGVIRFVSSYVGMSGVIVFCALLSWLMPNLISHNILMVRTVPAALTFWLIGCVLKQLLPCLKMSWWVVLMLIGSLFFFCQRVDMATAQYGNIILFYITAISINCLLFIVTSGNYFRLPILQIIGRCSLPLMCLHGVLPKIVAEVYNGTLSRLLNLLLLVLITTVIYRYVPILNGKSRIFTMCWK